MVQWSQAAADLKRAEKLKAGLAERVELFKRFRDGGWEIAVLNPAFTQEWVKMPDDWAYACPYYLMKMPGAHPMCIKTVEQLRRLVRGVS